MTIFRNRVQEFFRTIGNTEPVGVIIQDNDGVAIDVTGLTFVVDAYDEETNSQVVTAAATTLTDATNGKVSWNPSAAAVASARNLALYFKDTTTSPNRIWPYDGARFLLVVRAANIGRFG